MTNDLRTDETNSQADTTKPAPDAPAEKPAADEAAAEPIKTVDHTGRVIA